MMETREQPQAAEVAPPSEPISVATLRRELTTIGLLYLLLPVTTLGFFIMGLRPLAWAIALFWIGASLWRGHKALAIGVAITGVVLWVLLFALTGRLI